MERKRIQDDYKVVEEATYKGYRVRVVCGYSALDDEYIVHLYIAPPTGPEVRVFDPPRRENHRDDALDLAFSEARKEIDFLAP